MTRTFLLTLVFATLGFSQSTDAADPDPSKLNPSPELMAKATLLIDQLGDPMFQVREGATVELRKLGRSAKPAVTVALKTTDDPEVRSRCENLLLRLEKDDVKVRLAAFLADTECKYQHDLPGWDRLAKVTGHTKQAKQLYANLCETPQNWEMVKAASQQREQLSTIVAQRRTQLYLLAMRSNRSYEYNAVNGTDIAGLLLCEIQLGSSVTANSTNYTMSTMLTRIREDLVGESGEPLRKLTVQWLDTRTDPNDLAVALRIACQLNLKEAPAARYASKLMQPSVPVSQRMGALLTLAQYTGKDALPMLTKSLNDTTKHNVTRFVGNALQIPPPPNGGNVPRVPLAFVQENVELQMRDVALAMCLVVNDLNPLDFGFEPRFPKSINIPESQRFMIGQYLFASDIQRKAAFAKWDEWSAKK